MAAPFTLDMVEGGGQLRLRGAADPYLIQAPTSVTGSVDTGDDGDGTVSGVTFATPPISFEQEITDPLPATVFIDADFSQVSAGSGTGSIDADGNVLIQTALKVDLHIEVLGIQADCVAQPINLNLASAAPYDPATGQVTLTAGNFSVPAAPVGGSCPEIVADGINGQLAGGGHSLSLTLEGDIELPPPAGCDTVTELAVSPEGGARLGDDVTLDVTVAMDPDDADSEECQEVPAHPQGLVDVLDGTTLLDTVALVDGTASVVTERLSAGDRTLRVRYRGELPYRASTSDPTPYRVTARPNVVVDLPEVLQIGAGPVPFQVELDNNGLGFDVLDARLDLSVYRTRPGSLLVSHFTVEYHDGEAWVPVPLTAPAPGQVLGTVGPTFAFRSGEHRVIPLRVTPSSTAPAAAAVGFTFELVEVDPVTALPAPAFTPAPAAVARAFAGTTVVEGTRRPSTVNFRLAIPPTAIPVIAPVTRQGSVIEVPNPRLSPSTVNDGYLEVLLNGQPLPVRRSSGLPPTSPEFADRSRVAAATSNSLEAMVPPTFPPGTHELRVRYSGDAGHLPSISPATPVVVLPSILPIYHCRNNRLVLARTYTVHVQAWANVPTYARAGTDVDLTQFQVDLFTDRGNGMADLTGLFGSAPLEPGSGRLTGISFDLAGGLGQGSATSMTRTGTPMLTVDTANPDGTVTFAGEAGTVALPATPGETVPVTLDAIRLGFSESGPNEPANAVTCTPTGDPIELGRTTTAGTSLSVSPEGSVRVGRPVTLTASVAPAGFGGNLVFTADGTTVGVVPVAPDGTASTTTVLATPGAHTLKARFFGGLAVLSSEAEQVIVAVPTACSPFAVEGNGATVRLVYLELLRRCPDQAGFDYWTGRLDSGTSPDAFARTIARTAEAVGVVVDDGYRTMLGRPADPAGRAFWVGQLQRHGRYDQLLADLAASDEFWTLAGSTDAGFVTRVYERLLERAPEQSGLDHWVGRLNSGTPRRTLVLTLANLDEPLGVLVVQSYDEILARAPSPGERSAGITHLRSTGDRSGLYAQLIGRPEFATRAQGFPNTED